MNRVCIRRMQRMPRIHCSPTWANLAIVGGGGHDCPSLFHATICNGVPAGSEALGPLGRTVSGLGKREKTPEMIAPKGGAAWHHGGGRYQRTDSGRAGR